MNGQLARNRSRGERLERKKSSFGLKLLCTKKRKLRFLKSLLSAWCPGNTGSSAGQSGRMFWLSNKNQSYGFFCFVMKLREPKRNGSCHSSQSDMISLHLFIHHWGGLSAQPRRDGFSSYGTCGSKERIPSMRP